MDDDDLLSEEAVDNEVLELVEGNLLVDERVDRLVLQTMNWT